MEILRDQVYATQPKPLQKQIENLLNSSSQEPIQEDILAVIVPDTNLLRTGSIPADVYRAVSGQTYDLVIGVSPSHMGSFGRMTICDLDAYQTPLGSININTRVVHELCDEDDDIFLDDTGHFHTRGIGVQLPFLQNILPEFDFVPIIMGVESPDFCRELGSAIGAIMFNRRTLLVASADILSTTSDGFEHFRTAIKSGDVSTLMPLLNSTEVDILGKGAILVAIIASLKRRAKQFRILSLEAPSRETPGSLGVVITR